MRVKPKSVTHLEMLIDQYLPGCNFLAIDAVDVDVEPAVVWAALHDLPAIVRPTGLLAFMLRLAAFLRGDIFRRRETPLVWMEVQE